MYGQNAGLGRWIVPVATVPAATALLSHTQLITLMHAAVVAASSLALWGLVYAVISRGGK